MEEDAIWFGFTTRTPTPANPSRSPSRSCGTLALPCSARAKRRSSFAAMPNGVRGKGSHTHCDKLSIVFRLGADEVFCDSGSRCYTRSAELRNQDRSTRAHNTLMVDGADQNILSTDPRLLFRCGNEAVVSPIQVLENSNILEGNKRLVRASHQGYSRIGVEHQRTVELAEWYLLIVDEVGGTGEHLLELQYVLGPGWGASSEMMSGETVSCVITGPRRLTFQCHADSALALSVTPAQISRAYGAAVTGELLYPDPNDTACLPATVQTRVQMGLTVEAKPEEYTRG